MPDKEYRITAYNSVQSLLLAQKNGENIGILLLDICMPEQNGISAAQEINRISPATQIIFISAFASYALDVYEAVHTYFLTKPVRPDKLRAALSRAIDRIAQQRDTRILLPVKGGEQHILALPEIQYFERQNHVTHTVLSASILVTRLKLSDIEALLPPGTFARPHNSYLANLSHVRAVSRANVCLSGDYKLPISNQKRAAFLQALAQSF